MTPTPSVPLAFPGATIVCLGGGPSLTPSDVDAARALGPVLAVNDAYRLAPWADVLYACDGKWWTWHQGVASFTGPKYSIDPQAARWPGVTVLRNTGVDGLELDPAGLRTGMNSGYQAINLAVHLGAARIVLLGYDMGPGPGGRTHWFGDHPDRQPSPYHHMLALWPSIVAPLAAAGVTVINASRRTALTVFPCVALETVLQGGGGLMGPCKPIFPPNRVIKEGEPICRLCGSGYASHADGTRRHTYKGRLPIAVWLARLFGGAR